MKIFTLICLVSLLAFSGGLLISPFALNQGYASDSKSIESYREQIRGLVQDLESKVEIPEDLDRIRYAFDLELDVNRQDMLLMAISANATSETGFLYRNIIEQSIHHRRNDAFLSKKLIESLKDSIHLFLMKMSNAMKARLFRRRV